MEQSVTYQQIQQFWTMFKTLPDGRKLAAILMPSITEYKYSASKVRVTHKGALIKPKSCAFIKPPTYEEMRLVRVNNMMHQNYVYIKDLMYSKNDWTIWEELEEWMRQCTENHGVSVIRLFYGGDFYFLSRKYEPMNPLEALNTIVQHIKNDSLQVIVRTANIASADNDYYHLTGDGDLDSRIRVVAETQGYEDMPLFIKDRVRYHWYHENAEGTVSDADSVPVDATSHQGFFQKEVQIVIPKDAYEFFIA